MVLVCCIVSFLVLLLGLPKWFCAFSGICISLEEAWQPYKATLSPSRVKKLLFFYFPALRYLSHFIFEIASSRFFSCTCRSCNYIVIFTYILPELILAYDMRSSMAARLFSLPPHCPYFFFTLQIYPAILSAVSWYTISVAIPRELCCAQHHRCCTLGFWTGY